MAQSQQYRLKANAGAHHQDGKVYRAGDVVTSRDNLALMFREKFEVVNGPQPIFVGPQGGRTGNERPEDHKDVHGSFDDDSAADAQAKTDNADLDDDGVDTDREDLAENIADNEAGSGTPVETSASAGRPKRSPGPRNPGRATTRK